MKQKSVLGSAIVVILIVGAILFFSEKSPSEAPELQLISAETLYEIAAFDVTDRYCIQFQFIEKKGEHQLFGTKSCTGILQRETGPLLVHLADYPQCPAPGDLLLGELTRNYGSVETRWVFHKEEPAVCAVSRDEKLRELETKLPARIRLGQSEKEVEGILGKVQTLSEGLYYVYPDIVLDIEMRDGKVFQRPRFYTIAPLSCTQPCVILSSTAIQSKRSEFILVTKFEENKKHRFGIQLCSDRRSVCKPFELKNVWTYEAFQNAFLKYKQSSKSEPALVYLLQRVFVDGETMWESSQLGLQDIKILLLHFDQTAFD